MSTKRGKWKGESREERGEREAQKRGRREIETQAKEGGGERGWAPLLPCWKGVVTLFPWEGYRESGILRESPMKMEWRSLGGKVTLSLIVDQWCRSQVTASPLFSLRTTPPHLHQIYQPAWPVTHILCSLSHYNPVSLLPPQVSSSASAYSLRYIHKAFS